MKKTIIFLILIIVIPLIIVNFNKENNELIKKYGSYNKKIVKVKRVNKNKIDEVLLEDYVVGVVAGEMPATFNIEALKAQAVTSRTYVINRLNKKKDFDVLDTTLNQVYLDNDDMKNKWKNNYEMYLKKVKSAVKSTTGEIILYNNEVIDAMFFSTSNGYTENSEDAFSSSKPYLVSVESKWDEKESPVFSTTEEVSKTTFLHNLNLVGTSINISDIKRTKGERIKSITINNKTFSGTKIREAFGLKSTCFNIKLEKDKVIFNVKGFGHGVGLSQYGSNGMAKENKNYKQIINHYFKNTEIKKVF